MTKEVFNVYRNTRFTKRNYECTNVAACIPVDANAKVPEHYEVVSSDFISNMTPLWIEGGIQYWGWL